MCNVPLIQCGTLTSKKRERQALSALESLKAYTGSDELEKEVEINAIPANETDTLISRVPPEVEKNEVELDTSRGTPPPIKGSETLFTLKGMTKLKKTWCKTEPIAQVIRSKGCISKTVMNRYCYGQCNSFYIPRFNKKGKELQPFKTCGFCRPKLYHTVRVTLHCPSKPIPYIRRKVRRIKQCRCMAEDAG
ncbi:hypothetical protein ACJMK2_037726 [Sinanodonta woodiana]|uniref:CTCK domain-containing protein n=1 Tax=Sinanodonta woodiana TaxID=1069815 RepID=A0ABD3WMQ1_SINWO